MYLNENVTRTAIEALLQRGNHINEDTKAQGFIVTISPTFHYHLRFLLFPFRHEEKYEEGETVPSVIQDGEKNLCRAFINIILTHIRSAKHLCINYAGGVSLQVEVEDETYILVLEANAKVHRLEIDVEPREYSRYPQLFLPPSETEE